MGLLETMIIVEALERSENVSRVMNVVDSTQCTCNPVMEIIGVLIILMVLCYILMKS